MWPDHLCLHSAIESGDYTSVGLLLAQGASVHTIDAQGRRPLHIAAEKGATAMVRILIQSGALLDVKDDRGWTPLHSVCRSRDLMTLDVLMEYAPDPSIRDTEGRTPEQLARALGHHSFADALHRSVEQRRTSPLMIPRSPSR